MRVSAASFIQSFGFSADFVPSAAPNDGAWGSSHMSGLVTACHTHSSQLIQLELPTPLSQKSEMAAKINGYWHSRWGLNVVPFCHVWSYSWSHAL